MLIYDLGEVTIKLDSDKPNIAAPIQIEGLEVFVEDVRRILRTATGAFGHLIGEGTTPIDLHAAISNSSELAEYEPKIIEGEDLVKSYNPQIPKGSIT